MDVSKEDKEILSIALECGIMISTAYGQKENQPMLVADHATIIDFANKIIKEEAEAKCKYADDYKATATPRCRCLSCRDKYIEKLQANISQAMRFTDSAVQCLSRNICPRQMLSNCMESLKGKL